MWQQTRGKKRAHWGILTLDDLPKSNWKYSQLIAQLQARYQADKELGIDKLDQKSEDFTI
ncbi:MAG: CsbD family protein [Chloroflexota bacterium]|nr:MAG: CsbD family protein [Chloroflexota bacterium]